MKIRYSDAAFFVMTAVIISFAVTAPYILPDRFFYDYYKLLGISSGNLGIDADKSFSNTAIVLRLLPQYLHTAFAAAVGVLAVYSVRTYLFRADRILISLIISLPAFIYCFSILNKDTFVIFITITSLFATKKLNNEFHSVIVIALIYLIYSYLFRGYYIIITGLFVSLWLIIRLNKKSIYWIIVPAVFLYLMVPDAVLSDVASLRDRVNSWRVYSGSDAIRTIFFNLYAEPNHIEFIANYIYSIIRLNLSFFISPGIRELWLTITAWAYIFLSFRALFSKASKHQKILGALVAAHILTLQLFEPDLGSYMRHVTSIFVLALPLIDIRRPRI